jgi:hypothetical protein
VDLNAWCNLLRQRNHHPRERIKEPDHSDLISKLEFDANGYLKIASSAILLALIVIVVNRFGFPLMAVFGAVGFGIMLYLILMARISFDSWVTDNKELLNSAPVVLKVEKPENPVTNFLKTLGIGVDKGTLSKLANNNVKFQGYLPLLVRQSLGDGEQIKGLYVDDKEMKIKINKHDWLALPLRLKDIPAAFKKIHLAALDTLTEPGTFLHSALVQYRNNAKSCARQSNLAFPEQWHRAIALSKELLLYADMTLKANKVLKVEGVVLFSRPDRLPRKPLVPILRELERLPSELTGLTDLIAELSMKLQHSCQAQLKALDRLEHIGPPIDITQHHRGEQIAKKALRFLTPLYDARFIKNLSETHPAPMIAAARQYGPQDRLQAIEEINWGNNIIWKAILLALVSSLILARLPNLLMRGIMLLFPCLEILRCCK